MPAGRSLHSPKASGPRCSRASAMRRPTSDASSESGTDDMNPAIPHMDAPLRGRDRAPGSGRGWLRGVAVATLRPRRDERPATDQRAAGGQVKAAIVHDWLTGYAGSERVL